MKKILSFVLTFVILLAVVPFSISAADSGITLSIDNGNGGTTIEAGAGKVAKVYVKVSGTSSMSSAAVTINYDTALELIDANNGMILPDGSSGAVPYFNDMSSSAIYGANFGATNGTYIFVASHNMQNGNVNVSKAQGYFVTLSFKIPDNAKVGEEYNISINEDLSSLVVANITSGGNLQTTNLEFTTTNG